MLLVSFGSLACKPGEHAEPASCMGLTKRLDQNDSLKNEALHTRQQSISTFSHLLKKDSSDAPQSSHPHAGQVNAARDLDCSNGMIGSPRWLD